MIIGVCGWIGSGKDTIADYLCNFHEFRRESFANTLKDAVAAVFGWDRILLEGKTREARAWREQVDPWWAERLGMPNLTPRWVLQYWGTEVCRKSFHDDIWIASLEHRLTKTTDNIVISDCRFANEVDAIKRTGGQIVWVQRNGLPEWYDCAMLTLTTPEDQQWIISDQEQDMEHRYPDVHVSEWHWLNTDFDAIIDNNGTIDELYSQIRNLVPEVPVSRAA
jgi:hypothetical protein